MNSYKQINENWQKFIKEQEQEPKVDKSADATAEHNAYLQALRAAPGASRLSALDEKVKNYIVYNIELFAKKKANDFVKASDIGELAAFKKELTTRRPETWLAFYDKDNQYLSILAEDFLDRATGGFIDYNWSNHPSTTVPDVDYGMGALFAYEIVTHAEESLGRPIDVQLAAATVPEVADEVEGLGVTDLSQIEPLELDIEDLKAIADLDREEPPKPEPLPEPPPPSDSEPDAPKAAPAPEPEAPASPDDDEGEITLPEPEMAIAGINSEVYDDSLINMLKNSGLAKALSREQISQLLSFMLQATEQDDIVLEAIGDPERAPRTYSPETTRQLNDLINSFNLSSEVNQKLEKLIKKWAKLNTVKFSPPAPKPEPTPEPTPEPSPGEEEDTSDEPTETGPPRSTEDEESGIVDKAIAIGKQKAQDLGVEIPDVDQVKLALDAISFAGVTGAGELVATPATLASLALNIGTRDWDDALIDVVSLLPVAGKAFRLSAKTAKSAKAAKTLATAADISSRAGKIADVVKKGKAAGNVAKNLGMVLGSRLDKKEF